MYTCCNVLHFVLTTNANSTHIPLVSFVLKWVLVELATWRVPPLVYQSLPLQARLAARQAKTETMGPNQMLTALNRSYHIDSLWQAVWGKSHDLQTGHMIYKQVTWHENRLHDLQRPVINRQLQRLDSWSCSFGWFLQTWDTVSCYHPVQCSWTLSTVCQ